MNARIKRIYDKKIRLALLLIQLLLLYIPTLQLFVIKTESGSIPASLCYFFSVVFVPYLALNIKSIKLPPWYITLLCIYVYALAVIRIPQYGLAKNILHWVFDLYILIVIINVGSDFTMDEWTRILECGAVIFAVAHFVYMILDYKTIGWLLKGYFSGELNGNYGVYLGSLTRGGRNLDATWMALGGFFVKGKKKTPYVTYLILFSVLGGSRVGVVASCVLIIWSLIYDKMYHLTLKNIKYYILYAIIMFGILFGSGMGQAFLGRMFSGIKAPEQWEIHINKQTQDNIVSEETTPQNGISNENGEQNTTGVSENMTDRNPNETTEEMIKEEVIEEKITSLGISASLSGRAVIWKNIPLMFRDNPWGYGVGNTMRVMKKNYGFDSFEDIAHNVFFQWVIDEGFIGGMWFVFLVILFLVNQWRHRPYMFASPFDGYFLAYIILSFFQFHGAETLMVYVLGIYIIYNKEKLIALKNIGIFR